MNEKYEKMLGNLEDYLNRHGVDTSKRKFRCLICGSSDAANFVPNSDCRLWKCFSGNHVVDNSGNIYEYVKQLHNVDFAGACKILDAEYGVNEDSTTTTIASTTSETSEEYDPAYTNYLVQDTCKVLSYCKINPMLVAWRGISVATLKRFGVCYYSNWIHPKTAYKHEDSPYLDTWRTDRIIIPTSDSSYLARAVDSAPAKDDPAYKYYVKCYKVGKVVLFKALHSSNSSSGKVYVVEGEIDALSIYDCGYDAIALGSANNVDMLFGGDCISKDTILIISMDNDSAGVSAARKLESLCIAHGQPYILADSNALYGGLKDANELLQADRNKLTDNLKDVYSSNVSYNINSNSNNIEEKTSSELLELSKVRRKEEKEERKKKRAEEQKRVREERRREKVREFEGKIKDAPKWIYVDEKGNICIDEPLFCRIKAEEWQCRTINGSLYTIDGVVLPDAKALHLIQCDFGDALKTNIAKRADQLLRALKQYTYIDMPAYDGKIHLANGTYNVSTGTFSEGKEWCINRLSVSYNPDASAPVKWITYLGDLLDSEDICTVQEYLGYCLIRSTVLQSMLFLLGNGNEGKSVLVKVFQCLLGSNNFYSDKIHELQRNRFKLANLENKLLFVDDDLLVKALDDTGVIKTLITGGAQAVERKGQQAYNVDLYARGICLGNVPLTALYDHSDGFYRRQLIIRVKPRDLARAEIPYLDKIIADEELEGILLWCIEGLRRLIKHNYRIYVSPNSALNLEQAKVESFNFLEFCGDRICFDASAETTANDIYNTYSIWCADNGLDALKRRTVIDWMRAHEREYNISYTNTCRDCTGKRVRGFKGLRIVR